MSWMIVIVILLLVIGPIRRRLLYAWRFTVPGIVGFFIAIVVSGIMVDAGAPSEIIIAAPILAFFIIGAAAKEWLDNTLGPPRKR